MRELEAWRTEIDAAAARLAGRVVRTELRRADALSARAGAPVLLKLENRQTTGSFKLRGATNAVALLDPAVLARGLVTASTGNHGRALAHAAAAAGARCTVFVSALVPPHKREGLSAAGAAIRILGRSQDEAEDAARAAAAAEGGHFVPPFDDPGVIAGQGTIGLEIMDALPDAELVLVPLSGGGLAGGVAAAVKARRPATRVIGVSMARGAAMQASLAAGHPVEVTEEPTLADALGGGIGRDNRYTFALARELLDDVVLLSEQEIAAGIRAAFAEGEVVEGGGAVGIGALLAGKADVRGPVAVILSGGNIDPELHRRILAEE
ncbi:MAG TPA: hydroxyectoine utilization dehydratase EutB [Acetobacteraceae bacterium]|nr:hydroxyectoine utilization dehydratase EutB [Acetobacteraceae bacterium]